MISTYRPQTAAAVFRIAVNRSGADDRETRERGSVCFDLGRQVIVLLALATLVFQSVIVQSHIHPDNGQAARHFEHRETYITHSPGAPAPGDDPSDCPICRELAHAGRYLIPPALLTHVVLAPIAFMSVRPLRPRRPPAFPLTRHSRAPPERLPIR